MKHIYLAGPIGGLTTEEAKDWRDHVCWCVNDHAIRAISPLRCEPPPPGPNEKYSFKGGDDAAFGTAKAIGSKNEFDVRNCDILLAYMPTPSHGTDIEIGMAHALNKPVILVSEDQDIRGHAVRNYVSNWILSDIDEAIDLLIGLLGEYR